MWFTVYMAQEIKPGDRIAYSNGTMRREGVALLVAADRVVAALAPVSADRVDGEEIARVGRESTTPAVLPAADVEVLS